MEHKESMVNLTREDKGIEETMAGKECGDDDLLDLASFVAEKLRRVHGVERAPAPDDYRVVRSAVAGKAPRIEVKVNLGRGLVFMVHAAWRGDDELDVGRVSLAELFFRVIAMLNDEASELAAVQRMAKRRIAKCEAAGMPCRLLVAEPNVINIDEPTSFWISIEIEGIDESLRTGSKSYWGSSRYHTARFFDEFDRSQAQRMAVRAFLAGKKATAAIDVVLLNALRRAGVADAETFRRLNKCRERTTEIIGADGTIFRLRWSDGEVLGSVLIEEGVKCDAGQLKFSRAPRRFSKRDVGRLLVDIYPHPLLVDCAIVTGARGKKDCSAWLNCSLMVRPFHLEDERIIGAP